MLGWARCGFHKMHAGTRYAKLVAFASGGIYESQSAFRCVRGVMWFPEKACQDTLRRTRVLHPVGSTGHVVQSGVSGAGNIDTLFFRLVWAQCGFQKKRGRTCCAELVFLHSVRYVGHVVHSPASEA
jgi:hypothetical protein